MPHYFISYSTEDGAGYAERLYEALRGGSPPLVPWLAPTDLKIGDWPRQVDQAIKDCTALLLVLTAHAVASPEVDHEWSRALRYKKPIVPLRFEEGVLVPMRLEGQQEVAFGADFETSMGRLRSLLTALDTPAGRIAQLEQRKRTAERDVLAPHSEIERARAELEVGDAEEELRTLREGRRSASRIVVDDEREARPGSQILTINRAPSPPLRTFQDRTRETELIGEFLDDPGARVLIVVGRGGVGKTAMVTRALHGLQHGNFPGGVKPREDFQGIVYLGAGATRDISFANFYEDLVLLLPKGARSAARSVWQDQASTAERINALATLLAHRPVIVLLDNFEDLLDRATGAIADAEFADVLRLLLGGPEHAIKVIITTREAPRELALVAPGRQQYIELDRGLPSPDAQNLLRAMDRDGKVGLRDASDEILDAICETTLGFPRALEVFFGVLRADRFTSVDELLAAVEAPGNPLETIVVEAFTRLDAHARRIVQALAVYPRPVPSEAVAWILGPDVLAGSVEATLRRLTTMFLVQHDQRRYYLHAIDRAHALSELPVGTPGDWTHASDDAPTLTTLRFRAAEYLRARRPYEFGSSADLEPGLDEFGLRQQAGDVAGAVDVLLDHGDAMITFGQRWLLLDLVDEVFDATEGLDRAGLLALTGYALASLGRQWPAVDRLRAAIDEADDVADPDIVAGWRLELARCLFLLHELDAAVDELQEVAAGDGTSEGWRLAALLELGRIALARGRRSEADDLQRQVLRGVAAAVLGEPDDALSAEEIASELGVPDLYDPEAWNSEVRAEIYGAAVEGDVELLADVWLERASLALAGEDLRAAKAACELALEIYEDLGSFAALQAMNLLDIIKAELGPPSDELLAEQERRLADARERRITSVEADLLGSLAQAYLARDCVDDGERAYRDLEQLGLQEHDRDHVVAARLGLARVAWIRDSDTAVDLLDDLLEELPHDAIDQRAAALALRGEIEGSAALYEPAIEHLAQASALFAELGHTEAMIAAERSLAGLERAARNYAAAQRRLEGVVAVARSLAGPSIIASVLADLLTARLFNGDRDGARALAEEAAQLTQTVHRPTAVAGLQDAVGEMWTELEDYEAAATAHKSARSIYRDLGRPAAEVEQLLSLQYVYGEAQRFEEALAVASEAVEIATPLADRFSLRRATVALALALADAGRYDEALLIVGEPLDEAHDAHDLGNIAWVYFLAGRYEKSLELSRRAMELDPAQEWFERNAAHALLALGRTAEAEATYRKIVEGRRGGEDFRRTIREVRRLLERHPDLPQGKEVLALLESAQAEL